MSDLLVLVGLVGLLAGLRDPGDVFPRFLPQSRLLAAVVFGGIAALGIAPRFEAVEPVDPWPGRAEAFARIHAALDEEAFERARGLADSCLALPYARDAADSLQVLRDHGDELALYAEARAIPAWNAAANRDAYRELAERYPENETYRSKAEHYTRESRRRASRPRSRAAPPSRGGSSWRSTRGPRTSRPAGCCRRCTKGVPCGNGCIARGKTCTKTGGCAC